MRDEEEELPLQEQHDDKRSNQISKDEQPKASRASSSSCHNIAGTILLMTASLLIGIRIGEKQAKERSNTLLVEQTPRHHRDAAAHLRRMSPNLDELCADVARKKCFETKMELQSALLDYRNGEGLDELELVYGLPIGTWCVSQITDMSQLFASWKTFNEDISNWDVSSVVTMEKMFNGAGSFNQSSLELWDVSSVENMSQMFLGASSFNGAISSWDVSSCTDMSYMFSYSIRAPVQQPLDCYWGPCKEDLGWVLGGASPFNQPLDEWDVSSVTSMAGMFAGTKAFDQTLDSWNVSSVTDMSSMFRFAEVFNQPLSSWRLLSVADTSFQFADATKFNQNLCAWGTSLSSLESCRDMFKGSDCPDQSDPIMSLAPPAPLCAAPCPV